MTVNNVCLSKYSGHEVRIHKRQRHSPDLESCEDAGRSLVLWPARGRRSRRRSPLSQAAGRKQERPSSAPSADHPGGPSGGRLVGLSEEAEALEHDPRKQQLLQGEFGRREGRQAGRQRRTCYLRPGRRP